MMKLGACFTAFPFILLGVSALAAPHASAEGEHERVVDLREVARAAAHDAPVVQTAARRVTSADAKRDQARASYWPTVDLEGNVSLLRQRQTSESPYVAGELKTRNDAARAVGDGRLDWMVTNFGGRAAAVERADSDARLARGIATQVRLSSLRNACERFIELLTTQRLRDNAAVTVARRESISKVIARLVEAGYRPRIDLQRADIETLTARTELDVLSAQAAAQASRLAAAMGLDPAQSLRAAELEESLLETELSEREVSELALSRRPELPLQEARVAERRAAVRVVRAELLPSLHVFTNVNVQRDAARAGRGFDQSGYIASGGLALRFRAFNPVSVRGLAAAKADVEVELAGLREQTLSTRGEAVASRRQVARARELLAQAEQRLEAARSTREAQYKRYQGGEASLLELLDAEAVEQDARSRRIATLRDLELSMIALLDATGTLQQRLDS